MKKYSSKHSRVEDTVDAELKTNIKNNLSFYITIGVAGVLLITSLTVLIFTFLGRKDNYDQFKNKDTATVNPDTGYVNNPIDFDELKKINPDICAYIQVDGTITDNPILQSSDDADDNFYLDHDENGNERRAGSIYIQKMNDSNFTDSNTLIYGHNMLNGTMFGQLKKFKNKDFFNQNRNIYVYIPGHVLQYEIISAFIYDDRHIMNSFNFDDEEEQMEFFNECLNPSSFTKQVLEGATLDEDDRIITLSTCTNNASERYLVIGKLINDIPTN